MANAPISRRNFLTIGGLGLTALSFQYPLTAFLQLNEMTDIFHNYEEALKNPLEVKTLSFSFNSPNHPYTKSLPDERISTLINLENLHINGFKGELINLPIEIRELKKIKELSIESENLVEIPKVVWELPTLKNLYLEINSLKDSDLKLSNLIQLQSFGIRLHKTETLPLSIFDNANLILLDINSDDLKVIPNRFNNLVNLKYLSLHCQNLNIFPSTIENLKNLIRIDIYNSTAKSIDINFKVLKELKEFRWGHSLFFPSSLTDAKNLKELTIDVSYFETIDANELIFQNLRHFELSSSKLQKIPKCFETLQGIQSMNLGFNNFKEIEFDFNKLTSLTYLSFRNCKNFEKIDIKKFINSLQTIKNLEYLRTPTLSKEQDMIRKSYNFKFNWLEE